MKTTEFQILRIIYNKSTFSQRMISKELNISLGKINYCLKQLVKKGFVKISNFSQSKSRSKYLYILTPKGISEKTRITMIFMKNKIKEYEDLKKELTRSSRIINKHKN